jgi:perosamine synthetase
MAIEETMNIRLFKPHLGAEELDNIRTSFERGWIGLGPNVVDFERKWSEYMGGGPSLAVNSATAALHLALKTFNFPKGKKVLVPAITFASTATAVLYNDLIPVFVDVDPVTIQMSIDDMIGKYSSDCVAVVPVHMGGYPVDMERLVDFAMKHDLKIIEDCAHCAGGDYKGQKLGTWGDIGCFSFEEKKLMTTGDGGMICSRDEQIIEDLKPQRWVGIDKDTWKRAKDFSDSRNVDAFHWHYEIAVLGYKYNMNDLCAAIGLAQLAKLDEMNQARSRHIERYLSGISVLDSITPLLPYNTSRDVYWLMGVRTKRRDDLIVHLTSKGISTGVHFYPLPLHPLFKKYQSPCPVAQSIWKSFITLPLFVDLRAEEIDFILQVLKEFDETSL